MQSSAFIEPRVHDFYWNNDINCATTTIKILSEAFEMPIHEQVLSSAIGMHGAGEYGAQCGLVEGTLMFLGIYGRYMGIDEKRIVSACYTFAETFEKKFDSLQCSSLRPEGFHQDNPPHLCEPLTCKAVTASITYIEGLNWGL